MGRLSYLLRNINILNILLIVILSFLVLFLVIPYSNIDFQPAPHAVKKSVDDKVSVDKKPADFENSFPSDYVIIAEQNLFHPERKITETTADNEESQTIKKADFVLYGTLIADDVSLAYMDDLKNPVSTPGRGKRQTTVKLGDSISGYTLKEVEEDKVVLVRNEDRVIVYLNDPENPKVREVPELMLASKSTATKVKPSGGLIPKPSVKKDDDDKKERRKEKLKKARDIKGPHSLKDLARERKARTQNRKSPSSSGSRRGGALLFPGG